MKRILVLGANGMLGHKVAQRLAAGSEVWGTVRDRTVSDALDGVGIVGGVVAHDLQTLVKAFRASSPHVVVNCIGVVKQLAGSADRSAFVTANAQLPHVLADQCEASGSRLIHISTDCVFSGQRGSYREGDPIDASDIYGRTKALGEIARPGCITLRTSIVGWQLGGGAGLLEWLAAHRDGTIQGYRRAVFSGLSTSAMSDVIAIVVEAEEPLSGLFHVSSEPISKYDLLMAVVEALGWRTSIVPVDEPSLDRSLDSTAFRQATGWVPPTWDEMIRGLATERRAYEEM